MPGTSLASLVLKMLVSIHILSWRAEEYSPTPPFTQTVFHGPTINSSAATFDYQKGESAVDKSDSNEKDVDA